MRREPLQRSQRDEVDWTGKEATKMERSELIFVDEVDRTRITSISLGLADES